MAANARSKATTWGANERVAHANFETVEANAAGAVNRANTAGGYKRMPLVFGGKYSVKDLVVATSGIPYVVTTTATDEQLFTFPLVGLPEHGSLSGVVVRIRPTAGHSGTPGVLPRVRLIKTTYAGTASVLATATYTWASTAAYENYDLDLTLTPGAAQSIQNVGLAVEYRNEGGSNAAGLVSIKRIAANIGIASAAASGGLDFSFWL